MALLILMFVSAWWSC